MSCSLSRLTAGFFLHFVLVFGAVAESSLTPEIKELAKDPQWLALLHYKSNTLTPGYQSFIDTPEFFLAEDGARNPENELAATVKKFESEGIKLSCRYPARLNLIQAKLKLFLDRKVADCPEFDEWQGLIAAKGVTLIFPASFLNNPASAFGHTFLRLDQDPKNSKADYYSYSINFSAHTFGEPGLIYAFKGIFGFYNGYFKVAPYFELVKRYSDLEKRDIWEYRLDFKQKEIDLLVQHLWELRNINFNYYYFDENCSYHLLGLIDVLRPSLKLREKFNNWVIPSDTLKAIAKNKDLVLAKIFRPSLSSKFNAREASTPPKLKVIAKERILKPEAGEKEIATLSLEDKITTLDLAYDYLDYLVVGDKIPADKSDPLAFKLLNERSSLGQSSPELLVPKQTDPLDSHASQRVAYGGLYQDKKYYQSFDLRLAYHDLLDSQVGFIPGSQINFMDFNFLLDSQQDFSLNRATIVDLVSLSPGNYFLKPLSWALHTGFQREEVNFSDQTKLVYKNELYLGRSTKLNEGNQVYLLGGVANKINTYFENNQATGGGVKFGWLGYAKSFNYLTEINYNRYFFGDNHTGLKYGSKLNFPLNKDWNFRLEIAREKDYQETFNSYLMNLYYYF